jgi:hypothetical protein
LHCGVFKWWQRGGRKKNETKARLTVAGAQVAKNARHQSRGYKRIASQKVRLPSAVGALRSPKALISCLGKKLNDAPPPEAVQTKRLKQNTLKARAYRYVRHT